MTFEGKNGLELELITKDDSNVYCSEEMCDEFRQYISSNFYIDDGKPEIPSNPYNNLGDLEDEVKDFITQAWEICYDKDKYLNMIGSDPHRTNFSSAHIHCSIKEKPNKKDIHFMRENLFSIQPFIALLSQNSPMIDGKISPCKDARLSYGLWSEFTEAKTDDQSHYLSLATGLSGRHHSTTLEVRIPSSSALLEQLFANLILIRTFTQLDCVPIMPLTECKDNFFKVIKYGGNALIPLVKPTGIGYLGFKGKKVYVKIPELFKLLLNDEKTKPIIKDNLSQLSSELRSRVKKFYKRICEGFTASDYFLQVFLEYSDETSFKERLDAVIKENFSRKKSMDEIIEKPNVPMYPNQIDTITIDELEEMLEDENFEFTSNASEEIVNLILDEVSSWERIEKVIFKRWIRDLSANKDIPPLHRILPDKYEDFLIENNVITSDDPPKRGKYFDAVLQIGEERGIL